MRHDSPISPSGFPNPGRVLLQSEEVVSQGDVVLDLPATPYNRFEVEIDNWAPTQNQVAPIFQLGVGGIIHGGASDYQLQVSVFPSNTSISSDVDDAHSSVRMTRDDNTVQAGNLPGEAFSYHVTISPGSGEFDRPRVWFQGNGVNDSSRMMGVLGFGAYTGVTSGTFGRADQIRFAFDANTIATGTFRLYGTE